MAVTEIVCTNPPKIESLTDIYTSPLGKRDSTSQQRSRNRQALLRSNNNNNPDENHLNAQDVGAHLDELVGKPHVVLHVVLGVEARVRHVARVADARLHDSAGLGHRLASDPHVRQVVHRVEDAEDVHAVGDGEAAEPNLRANVFLRRFEVRKQQRLYDT